MKDNFSGQVYDDNLFRKLEEHKVIETTINRDTKLMVVQQVNLIQIFTELKGKKDFLSISFSIFLVWY